MSRGTLRTPFLAAALGLAVLAVPVGAQQDGPVLEDGRWLPYLGCWVEASALEGPMTCVVADGPGVALLTVEDAEVTDRKRVQADGRARPSDVAGCTGTETTEFSSTGYRVYTRSELRCGTTERETRGLMAMVGANQWVEVRALGGDDGVAWVKRYRLASQTRIEAAGLADRLSAQASSRAVEMARAAASRRIAVEDVIEVTARTHPEAVKAWIAENGEPLHLNADRLVALADAGVPRDVIDVAVAVSFPDRFAVGRAADGPMSRGYTYGGRIGPWSGWNAWSPFYYNPYSYYGYNRFYGYDHWGVPLPGYTGYYPTVVVVSPKGPEQPPGRMVKGQGYTRGSSSSGTQARPAGSSGSSYPSAGATASGGSSTGVTGTPARSSGTRPGSKGKAKPRGSGSGGGGG